MASKKDAMRALASMMASADDDDDDDAPPTVRLPKDVQARVLTDMVDVVNRPCPFKIGDIIEQRTEFSQYRYPGKQLAVVTGFIKSPVYKGKDDDSRPVCRNDIIVLCRAHDSWVEFQMESWRFQKYEGEIA